MRVLITTDTVGGVWTFSRELTNGLLDRGCSVCLASIGRAPSDTQFSWISEMLGRHPTRFQFEVVKAPLEWEPCNEDAFTSGAPALLRLARDFAAEIIHSNQFCFGALTTDIPVIVTAHSDVLSWSEACRHEPLEESPWFWTYKLLVGSGLAHAAAITAPTRWMLDVLCRQVAPECLPPAGFIESTPASSLVAKSSVIPNGREIHPNPGALRRLQAITAGRVWDEAKNVALLAKVDAPLPLFVAGESRNGASSSWHELGQEIYLGLLSEQQMLKVFAESAIYICTSLYEPFGLAPLEAALCGCAILVNDLPSLRETWGDAALYFHDAESLSGLLKKLAGNPDLLMRCQELAIARAGVYTVKAMSSAYINLYEAVLQEQARSPESLRVA